MKKLIPHNLILEGSKIPADSEIHGGCIHAYYEPYQFSEAYAFRVFAVGRIDLACLAMYIPIADKTDTRRATLELVRKLKPDSDNKDFEPLFKLEPRLEKLFPLKQENSNVP